MLVALMSFGLTFGLDNSNIEESSLIQFEYMSSNPFLEFINNDLIHITEVSNDIENFENYKFEEFELDCMDLGAEFAAYLVAHQNWSFEDGLDMGLQMAYACTALKLVSLYLQG